MRRNQSIGIITDQGWGKGHIINLPVLNKYVVKKIILWNFINILDKDYEK